MSRPEAESPERKAKRKRIAWVAGSLLAAFLLLICGLAAYVAAVNQIPAYTPPPVSLPVPNAFDDFMAAGALVRESDDIQTQNGRQPETAALRKSQAVNQEAIAKLRAGFRHDYLVPTQNVANPVFPELRQFRSMARVLCAEGLLHEREGRPAEAARCYLNAIRLGATMPRGGLMIHWLVGIAVESIGLSSLQRAVEGVDAPTARKAARQLLLVENGTSDFSDALRTETEWQSAEMAETFRKVRTLKDYRALMNPLGTSGPSNPSEWWEAGRFLLTPKAKILRNYRSYMAQLAEVERQPYYAHTPFPPLPDDPYNQVMLPLFKEAGFSGVKEQALIRIIAVQLAARAYTLEHGGPPASAQALVPQYLDRVPDDPFAPRPITLKVQGGRAVVYSVGPDGVDDGGKSVKGPLTPASRGDLLMVRIQR